MIKAILFDLDGVLIETRDIHFRALNVALKLHNYLPITLDEHKQVFNGMPTLQKLQKLAWDKIINEEDIESIQALKQKETLAAIHQDIFFNPEIYCLFAGFSKLGYKLGIVTNAVIETLEAILIRLKLEPDVTVHNKECKSKPSPEPYKLATERLDFPPRECLVIEDGKYGIQSATQAGCPIVKVNSPSDVTASRIMKAIHRFNQEY